MQYDVIVIGGGPAGIVAATTAKRNYPEKSVALFRKKSKVFVPCGIPYIFGTLHSPDKNLLPDKPLISLGVDIIDEEVTEVEAEKRTLKTVSGKSFNYDKLIIATGSVPIKLRLPGIDADGCFTVPKDYDEICRLMSALERANSVVIIGGGFIGVEVADEIRKLGKEVHIVELLPTLLGKAFDSEFGEMARTELETAGVKVYTSLSVKEIIVETGKVRAVKLSDDTQIPADVVISSVGYKPDISLAQKIGLDVDRNGIKVDEFMRTNMPDIYAVGDCASINCSLVPNSICPKLASIATSSARLAAINLFEMRLPKVTPMIPVFSTKVGNRAFGATGLTETQAREMGYTFLVGKAEAPDHHPASLPGTSTIYVKLVVHSHTQHILGAQVTGGNTVGELVNLLAGVIQSNMTVSDLATLQVGTHPLLTSPPTTYPVVMAALDAHSKLFKR